jgi:hypothetical protein
MQFASAGFPEATQGIHFLHELRQIDKFAVHPVTIVEIAPKAEPPNAANAGT